MRKQDITRDAIQLKTIEKFVYSKEDWSSQRFFLTRYRHRSFFLTARKEWTRIKKWKLWVMTYQRAIIPFLNRSDKDIIKMQNVFGGFCSVFVFFFVFKVCITIKVFEIKSELSRIKALKKKWPQKLRNLSPLFLFSYRAFIKKRVP